MNTDPDDDVLFKALGHHTRRTILDALRTGPRTTTALCEILPDISRYTVMQHLGVLEQAELVIVERKGRERWNHLNAVPIAAIHDRWIGPYAAFAAEKMLHLERGLDDRGDGNQGETDRNDSPNL